jgi:glycosyltransferase involved in cell wall biosynthesis
MPQISVIIPAYNVERTVLETIQSVQQQTFQDFEIIVINDGSTDNTLEVVQRLEDNRIKIFSYTNGGLPTARNRGITHAQGEFISFIDADDLWTPDKLELQLKALQEYPSAGVAYSWFVCMVEESQSTSFVESVPVQFVGNVYPQLLLGNFVGNGSNILVRRAAIEIVGEFDPTLKSCEDWDYYLRLAADWTFALVPQYQIIYRKAAESMTSKVKVMEEQGLRVIERAYQSAAPVYQSMKNQSLAHFYRYCADLHFTHQRHEQALSAERNSAGAAETHRCLRLAIRLSPAILLDRYAQKLVVKLFLSSLLPSNLARSINRQIRKWFTAADPRVQS